MKLKAAWDNATYTFEHETGYVAHMTTHACQQKSGVVLFKLWAALIKFVIFQQVQVSDNKYFLLCDESHYFTAFWVVQQLFPFISKLVGDVVI